MMLSQRIRLPFAAVLLLPLSLFPVLAQTSPAGAASPADAAAPGEAPAVVLRVRVLLTKDFPALEVITNRPVVPSIHKLDAPSRLTIDLPNSSMSLQHKDIPINTEQLGSLHLDEEKGPSQSVHMVIDLRKALAYTWETAGNRLTIRLQSAEPPVAAAPTPAPETGYADTMTQPPSAPSLSSGGAGLIPVTPGGFGAVIFAGNRITPGSTITAGSDTAVLSLGKNGEVHLCPRSTVSVTTSSNGHDLMLGMSSGSLETHYNLDASINSVLTPDFRILLAGPGVFDYAISADTRGNTCVSALPGNTRSAIVSELIGDQSYEVQPAAQVMFHLGRLSAPDANMTGSCGCPAPAPVMRTSLPAGPVIPESKVPSTVRLAQNSNPLTTVPTTAGTGTQSTPTSDTAQPGSETSEPPPVADPNAVQARVEAPLIFRASDLPPAKSAASPKTQNSSATSTSSAERTRVALPASTITITTTEKQHHGFMGKVKGFFKSIFS